MFLIGDSPWNLIRHWNFTNSSGYWFMAQNMENIDFHTFFHCKFTTMVSTEVKLWFLSSLEYFWPDPLDTLSKVTLLCEKMHKVFKNKAQRCSTPLSDQGGVLGTQDLFFAHFTTFASAFFTVIFSNCLTIGYASFDAKKILNRPRRFLAN